MLPGRVVRGRQNPLHWKFPLRLRKTRKTQGMSASKLGLAAGLNKSTVSVLEDSSVYPRLPTVEKLARVLGVSPAWLAYGLGDAVLPDEQGPLRCEGLAARAREARRAGGLSVREADRRAGNAEGVVRSIEYDTMPALDTLEDLATALNVSPAWLAYGIGPIELARRGGGRTTTSSTLIQVS